MPRRWSALPRAKCHKHYEFGCKVRIVTTSRRSWIVGIDAAHDNPYDGATLKPALAQVKRLTGVRPEEAFVDKGFRGQRYHPKAVAVYIAGRRNLTPQLSKLLKRRSAIEPVIGHTKHDHGMNRNYLLGKVGDRINALLSGCCLEPQETLAPFCRTSSASARHLTFSGTTNILLHGRISENSYLSDQVVKQVKTSPCLSEKSA